MSDARPGSSIVPEADDLTAEGVYLTHRSV